MRKIIFLLFIIVTGNIVNAQDFQAKIHYKTILDFSKQLGMLKDPSTSLSKKKEIEDYMQFMKGIAEHSYTLSINNHESIYKSDETLPIQGENNTDEADDDYYKNFKDNVYVIKRDFGGRTYLVSEPMKTFAWKLSNEVKTIGKYVCHKASISKEAEREEQVKNEDGSFELKLVKIIETTTAWYAPEIQIMNGPTQYGGLPGLILEISNDHNKPSLSIIFTEIELNPKKEVKIKRPVAKKYYTDKQYRAEVRRVS